MSTTSTSALQTLPKLLLLPPARLNHHDRNIKSLLRENIYTVPNLLTLSRMAMSPVIGYLIVNGDFNNALSLLAVASLTDLLDGHIARKFNQKTVLGSALDPAADKILMTVLSLSLCHASLLPVPLAVMIISRDIGLTAGVFVYRYFSLPKPRTWSRYWDVSLPSAEIHPPLISKVNTALQLGLMGSTLLAAVLAPGMYGEMVLEALRWAVGGTTVWSTLAYMFDKSTVRMIRR